MSVAGSKDTIPALRPAEFCLRNLAALDATEGRRRRRKRDTTPDAIGMSIKRELLEAASVEDPEPADFEGWLLQRCLTTGAGSGMVRAMAMDVFAEWCMAQASPDFREWLEEGAPSEDTQQ